MRWFPRWFARWFLEIGGWFPESVRWFAQMAGVVPLAEVVQVDMLPRGRLS